MIITLTPSPWMGGAQFYISIPNTGRYTKYMIFASENTSANGNITGGSLNPSSFFTVSNQRCIMYLGDATGWYNMFLMQTEESRPQCYYMAPGGTDFTKITIYDTPQTLNIEPIGGVSTFNMSLQNIGTIQQIKYALNAGAETTLVAGASANITGITANSTLKVNPILTPRPIHFTSNGRVQKITYNAIDYNVFPTDISVDVSGTPTLDITGNPAPEITVDYTNTSEPVITDT